MYSIIFFCLFQLFIGFAFRSDGATVALNKDEVITIDKNSDSKSTQVKVVVEVHAGNKGKKGIRFEPFCTFLFFRLYR